MPDIVILTAGDSLRAEYVKSLVDTINFMNEQDVSHKWGNSQGSLVGWVRNRVYQEIRKLDFNKLLWIDSDISWDLDAFSRIISSDKDIISGMYLNINKEPVGQPRDFRAKMLMHDIVEMEWLGLGFLCITKDVVDALAEPFIRDGHYGEDVAFCLNARDAGFELWLDPTIRVTHHKVLPLTP
jgi:hypothetical protein